MKVVKLLPVCILFLCSCASIVTSTTWPVTIETIPATDASVKITDKNGTEVYSGKTPATVRLKSGNGYFKKSKYLVQITSEGYEPITLPLRPKLNSWYFGNIVFGGVIGMLVVDPITGSMYRFSEKPVSPTMNKSNL